MSVNLSSMKAMILILCLATFGLSAQPKIVSQTLTVSGQQKLNLEFTFANEITFEIWDKKEVFVEVSVEINGGEDNDIFSLSTEETATTLYFEMDKDLWKKLSKDEKGNWNNCNITSEINYKVFLPRGMKVKSNTISGDYAMEYFGQSLELKTISGAIDVTVPTSEGLDFKAKTISGEVFSDMKIQYPNGKEGLRQVVGQNIEGRINGGGDRSELETISGNIYLRKQ